VRINRQEYRFTPHSVSVQYHRPVDDR